MRTALLFRIKARDFRAVISMICIDKVSVIENLDAEYCLCLYSTEYEQLLVVELDEEQATLLQLICDKTSQATFLRVISAIIGEGKIVDKFIVNNVIEDGRITGRMVLNDDSYDVGIYYGMIVAVVNDAPIYMENYMREWTQSISIAEAQKQDII